MKEPYANEPQFNTLRELRKRKLSFLLGLDLDDTPAFNIQGLKSAETIKTISVPSETGSKFEVQCSKSRENTLKGGHQTTTGNVSNKTKPAFRTSWFLAAAIFCTVTTANAGNIVG